MFIHPENGIGFIAIERMKRECPNYRCFLFNMFLQLHLEAPSSSAPAVLGLPIVGP